MLLLRAGNILMTDEVYTFSRIGYYKVESVLSLRRSWRNQDNNMAWNSVSTSHPIPNWGSKGW